MAQQQSTSVVTILVAVCLGAVALMGIGMVVLNSIVPSDVVDPKLAAIEKLPPEQRNAALLKWNEEQASIAEKKAKKDANEQVAMRACEEAKLAVKAKLKTPSRAEFPGCVFGADKYSIRASPDMKTVWVEGYVDSQNSYGAMLRSVFMVKLTHDPSTGEFTKVKVAIQ